MRNFWSSYLLCSSCCIVLLDVGYILKLDKFCFLLQSLCFWTTFLLGFLRVLYFIYLGHKFKTPSDITAWGSSSWKLCDSICPCPGMLIYFGCLSSVGWYLCLSNKVDWYILIKHQKCGLAVNEVGENCGRPGFKFQQRLKKHQVISSHLPKPWGIILGNYACRRQKIPCGIVEAHPSWPYPTVVKRL